MCYFGVNMLSNSTKLGFLRLYDGFTYPSQHVLVLHGGPCLSSLAAADIIFQRVLHDTDLRRKKVDIRLLLQSLVPGGCRCLSGPRLGVSSLKRWLLNSRCVFFSPAGGAERLVIVFLLWLWVARAWKCAWGIGSPQEMVMWSVFMCFELF